MNKKLALLTGIAISAVVLNHAARWGLIGLFGWQGQLSPAITPTPDQASGFGYYALVFIQQLCYFSVPAFLFISGFFIAYAAHSTNGGLTWTVLRTRIYKILVPYLIWSVTVFVVQGLQGKTFPITDYAVRLVTGTTLGAYYYIPMLCQFYLFAPLICRLGRDHPLALLVLAGTIQLIGLGYFYLELGGTNPLGSTFNYGAIFVWYAFYFPLGVVAGFRLKSFQQLIARYRWLLAGLTLAMSVLSVLEAELLFRATGNFEGTHGMLKLSTALFAIAFVPTFLAFDWKSNSLSTALNRIGSKSFGIYLVSPAVLFVFAQVTSRLAPQLLAHQFLVMTVFTVGGIGLVVLVMDRIARSPLRVTYHYLFG